MPNFIRKTTKKSPVRVAKKFVVKKPSVGVPLDLTNVESKEEVVDAVKTTTIHDGAQNSIDSLNKLLTKPDPKDSPLLDDNGQSNAVYTDDEGGNQEFNGVSDLEEQEELYTEAIDYERKKKKVIEQQVKLLEIEHQKEKRQLEQEIRNLKNELHRTTPIHDNKFFSLSKELREAIEDIEKIAALEGVDLARAVVKPSEPKTAPLSANAIQQVPFQAAAPITPVPIPNEPSTPPTPTVQNEEKNTAIVKPPEITKKKVLPKQKMMITGAVVTVLVMLMGSALIGAVFKKPAVDQKIVDKYLSEQSNGQVQGATTGDGSQGSNQQEVDPSQSNVSFEDSLWTEFKDSQFGVLLQYPKNAVKAVRTDSNITFIRKTGYLFKIQRIETSLTVEEYWKQIKATSLNYTSKTDKFKNKPALKLELEDMADYPGDRYLVKDGDFIYDIWYATPSNNFAKDDIQRAEKMLASLSLTGSKK